MKKSVLGRLGALLPPLMFLFAVVFFSVIYGMVAMYNHWFPYDTINNARQLPKALFPGHKPFFWEFSTSDQQVSVSIHQPERMQPGLTKIVDLENDLSLAIKVIDSSGAEQQRWRIEWSEIWPVAPDYLADAPDLPRSRPGTHIHGAEILANGDVVFNFEHLSLVRLDPCGNVVWKLPYRTHHSVFIDENSHIWVSAQRNHNDPLPERPFMRPPIIEPVVLELSPEGKILQEKSVFELLDANQLSGLLYATTNQNFRPLVSEDLLHLNDVEVFPSNLEAGFFQPGDIMISLRNVNTVLVFDRNWQLKYQWANEFVRQHDPDFIDGNTLMLLDNNNVTPKGPTASSRILMRDVVTGTTQVEFAGSTAMPFFTNVMGKAQRLANGNLLVTESTNGRAFELSPEKEIVWEYNNLAEPGWVGLMEEAERLPLTQDSTFFSKARARCDARHAATTQ